MKTLVLSCLLGALALLAVPQSADAQAFDTFGMGSRSASLGGAVTADVSDFSANYYNPGGLVREPGLELSVGYFRGVPDMSVDGRDSNVDGMGGTVFGVKVPGQFGDLRFAFGVAVHLPDARLSRTRSLPRRRPRWELYDNRPHRSFLGANLAVRPVEWLHIGGGVAFLGTTKNRLDIRGSLDIPNPEGASRIEHSIAFELGTIRYPQLGVQFVPHEQWSFGVVYRGEFSLNSRLDVEVDALITGLGDPFAGLLLLETESVNAFGPQQVSMGASYRPMEALHLSAELTWVDWSDYRSPIGRSDTVLKIEVPAAFSEVVEAPDSIASTDFIPARFRDRWVPRVGVEARVYTDAAVDAWARGGYFFERTPVPEQVGTTNLIDTDRHAISVGFGLALKRLKPLIEGRLTLDAHFGVSIFPERTTIKSSLVDPIGDYTAKGLLWAGGLTAGVHFE